MFESGKRLRLYVLAIFLGLSVFSWSWVLQNREDVFLKVTNAIALGNARALQEQCHSSIELETPESSGIYSRLQSEQILKRFFDKHPPVSFQLQHQGFSNTGSRFAIGHYISSDDESFRVSIFVKKQNGTFQIHELRFE
jgi:hypothetical protein